MSRIILALLILFSAVPILKGQQDRYSMYSFANAAVNPAKINQNNSMEASSIFRSQRAIDGVELTTAFLDFNYPLFRNKKRISSVGLAVGNDRAGQAGIFETNEIAATYASTLILARPHMLSIGGSLKYVDARVNTERLFTGSQFVEGVGFDSGISSGEAFDRFQTSHFSTVLGMHWKVIDKTGTVKSSVGASVSDINRPDASFVDGTKVPIRTVIEGSYRLRFSKKLAYHLEIFHLQSGSIRHTLVGVRADLNLYRYNRQLRGQNLAVLAKYRAKEAVVLGAIWQIRNTSLGASYELPVLNGLTHDGAFEIVLKYKKRRKPKRKRKRHVRTAPPLARKGDSDEIEDLLNEPEKVEQEPNIDDEQDETPSTNDIDISKPILLYFNFDFGSTEPILENVSIIDQISDILLNDPSKQIVIVGHTDGVGNDKFNYNLSLDRAESIYDLLTDRGVDSFQLSIDGKGEEEPISTNETKAGRALNRRVEIIFK
ncbi:MAG: PorP/SprF family type IX secretion system membrane protein [Ekhidna sp.]|nr:PorP/SprF family type IX secretion system membrane protein [Ekhidna sp.]